MARPKKMDQEAFLKKYSHTVINPAHAHTTFIPTGSIKLDKLLRGGLKRGTISEWYGPNRSGKSTSALKAAAGVLRRGGTVFYFDLEVGLDVGSADEYDRSPSTDDKEASEAKIRSWLAVNGVNPYDPNFVILQPDTGEEMYEMLVEIVENGIADLVVVDSMAAITARREAEGKIGDANFGAVAALNSSGLKAVQRRWKYQDPENRPHIILINQARAKVNSPVGGTKSTGGYALEHYVTTRVKVFRIGSDEYDGEYVTRSRVRVEKSRHAPQGETEILISSKRGIDVIDELLDYAVDVGYAHKAGSYFYFYEEALTPEQWKDLKREDNHKDPAEGFVEMIQGTANAKDWMESADWYDKLYDEAVNNW